MSCPTPATRRCFEKRFILLWILIIGAIVGLLYPFFRFAVPQLYRFDFHWNLSWYDLGAYGFGPSRSYASFEYESPLVKITESENGKNGTGCDGRYTFFAPHGDSVALPGPLILDSRGELVWKKHNWETTHDFKVQRYQGRDYLTYWEGNQVESRGFGSWYMVGCQLFTRSQLTIKARFDLYASLCDQSSWRSWRRLARVSHHCGRHCAGNDIRPYLGEFDLRRWPRDWVDA